MSFNPNRTSVLGAIVLLITACTISIAAQTPDVASSLTANPYSLREQKETASKKKSVPPGEDKDLTTGPAGESEVNTPSASPQIDPSDEWQFTFSPFVHLAGLHGTAGVGNRTAEVDQSFGDLFGVLKFAFMGTFEARKGKLFSLTDVEYVSVSDDGATPGPLFSDLEADFKVFIFDTEGGYRLFEDPDKGSYVDVLGGIRVWRVSTDLDFGAGILPAVQVEGSRTWVDGVAGLRGRAALSQKIFLTGKFDLGGGGSNFTYQIFGGGGYNLTPKVALILGYRVLDVNYNKDNFIYDMSQRGPILGASFRF